MSERRRKESSLERALEAIPIFPLPQVVLLPRAVLPSTLMVLSALRAGVR